MEVTLCRLSDKKVSVRLDETEVAILPPRAECELDDIEAAMQKVADHAAGDMDW